jgi:hypothetical protein
VGAPHPPGDDTIGHDTFARIRKELDSKGMFGNTLLRELFPY